MHVQFKQSVQRVCVVCSQAFHRRLQYDVILFRMRPSYRKKPKREQNLSYHFVLGVFVFVFVFFVVVFFILFVFCLYFVLLCYWDAFEPV